MIVLTHNDISIHGMTCEACGRVFKSGDPAYPRIVGITPNGSVIEGDFRCWVCWDEDRPVME